MTPELILFVGLQASGKSSFYRARFADTHTLVSRDLFPNRRNPLRRQREQIEEALGAGRSVVLDNTSPTPHDRAEPIAQARLLGAKVIGYHFESDLTGCLERNRLRTGRACVPDVALYVTHRKLVVPTLDEGFDQLFHVRLLPEGGFDVCDWRGND